MPARELAACTVTSSAEETEQLGKQLGQQLLPNTVLLLFGDLGAGKTTLIKGIADGASHIPGREVNSPTFTYLNIYEQTAAEKPALPFYHFDLYRLRDEKDFLAMGFDAYLEAGGICCIEWPERIASWLDDHLNCLKIKHKMHIYLSYLGEDERQVRIET